MHRSHARMARRLGALLWLWCVCGALLLANEPRPVADETALLAAPETPEVWLTHGRDYAETRFSPLDAISSDNVERLGVAWTWDTGTFRGLEATPLVADGLLYATAPWSEVFALDARTGELRWRWDPRVPRAYGQRACCDVINRGLALYEDKVFVGVLDGRLAALDALTGELIWQVQTTDPEQPYAITGAPRVVKGNVIIGNGGAEYGVRGYVSAYDAETGALSWRFHTVPGDPTEPFESPAMERAAETWTGEWWTMGGGGTVWDSMAYDPEADLLYIGTGNGSPWVHELRSPGGGDNLFVASILALRPDDGELVWYYQTTPGDNWDYTAVQHMILADLVIDGRDRKVLMQAPKNGFFYVLDRITGELLSAEPFSTVTWASHVDLATGRPVENAGARYSTGTPVFITPGPGGAHNWNPMSFNPQIGLVYIPAIGGGFSYVRREDFEYRPGLWNTGIDLRVSALPHLFPAPTVPEGTADQPQQPPGSLLAWDPVAGEARWRVAYESGANGGTLTTAGNLVFQGTSDGRFIAYSADRGERLWEARLGNSVIAGPVTYELDGEQYVAVLAGWGGAVAGYGLNPSGMYKAEGRVWAFKLDGGPIEPVQSPPRPPLTPIAHDSSDAAVRAGELLYAEYCFFCHGGGAASGGMIADLRYSSPEVFESYAPILLDGAYEPLGMPSFGDVLSDEDAAALRAYILSRRDALLAQ